MSDSGEGENEIRRRAAWMLAMLAVVAGLLVLLMTTVFNSPGGGGGSSSSGGTFADPYASTSSPATGTSSPPRPKPAAASRTPSSGRSTASSGRVPTPSCPDTSICAVKGDLAGATTAINRYREQNGQKPVTATITSAAEKCAVSSGNDCPSSFVWVHVTDLSGTALVNGVKGFNSGQDLLASGVTTYQLGWAYDPQSKTTTCAVIRGS